MLVVDTIMGLQAHPSGEEEPFAREAFVSFPTLASVFLQMKLLLHTTSPFPFKASVTVLLELGQKTTLVSSVSYKVKIKQRK